MNINRQHKLLPVLAFLLCCLLAAGIYLPGLSGDYLFDDTTNLLDNKALDIQSLDAATLAKAAFSSKAGELRRPVSMASFALNRYFFGLHPYSYKLINLAIHLLTGVMLYILARQITAHLRQQRAHPLSPDVTKWLPVAAAGIWLVHPLNLTSVLYIVQRMTSLSSLFIVIALCLYMIGRRRMLDNRQGMPMILGGLCIFGGLSIFSKETGVLLPLYVLTLELTLFGFRTRTGKPDRQIIAFFLVCVILPIAAGLLYLGTNLDAFVNYAGRHFTLTERLLTEARVVVFYLQMILAPTVQQLGLFHDDFTLSTGLLAPPATLYSILFLVALLSGALLLIRRQPLVSLGILWFFAGHALESTILPLELAHEHRNYLPGFGILLSLSGLVASLPTKRLAPVIQIAAPMLLLTMFASTTWLRSTQWSDNVNLSVYEARHHPDSPRAVFSAGRMHARLALNGHAESADKAFDFLDRASQLDKAGIMPAATIVKLNYLLERPVDPALFDEIIYRLENYPVTSSDIISLKDLAECQGEKCQIPHETLEQIFQTALQQPRPRLMTIYGYYVINKRGEFDKGLDIFRSIVNRAPNEPQYWINLINLLMVMTRFDEAQQRLDEFTSLQPYGSSEADFTMLQNDIDQGRLEYAQSINAAAQGTQP